MEQQNLPIRGIKPRRRTIDGVFFEAQTKPATTRVPQPAFVLASEPVSSEVREPAPVAPRKVSYALDQDISTVIKPEFLTANKSSKTGAPKTVLATLTAVFAVFSIVAYGQINTHQTTRSLSATSVAVKAVAAVTPAPAVTTPAPVVQTPDIATDMDKVINAQTGIQAAATLIDLDSGQTYNTANSSTVFTAASTSKLVAVFDYIHQVELGKATLAQNIGGMSGQDNIMRMIVNSDNDAWARLNKYLTFKGEQAYMNSLGIPATIQQDNMQFTTQNMAKLLQLLYQGKLMNAANQAMVYNYMSHTTVKNLIQAVLPADATVYHKYGQVEGVLHDASIIQYHGHNFVLVIYTNNPAGTNVLNPQQKALIHSVAQAAFADETVN